MSPELDKFGIKKIYSDSTSNPEKWEMGDNPNEDPRIKGAKFSRNHDGSWKVTGKQVRIGIRTSAGWDENKITKDQGKALEQGFMFTEKDWKNTETTMDLRVNKGKHDQITIYGPGGRHTGDMDHDPSDKQGCWGCAYKPRLYYDDGSTDIAKEPWHVNYFFTKKKGHSEIGNILEKWTRIKCVMYNKTSENGKLGKRIELWIDLSLNNDFKLIDSFEDYGSFSKGAKLCGCENDDQPIVWGGPEMTLRWDATPDVDIRNVSVREIST